jgi:hypothetical protein
VRDCRNKNNGDSPNSQGLCFDTTFLEAYVEQPWRQGKNSDKAVGDTQMYFFTPCNTLRSTEKSQNQVQVDALLEFKGGIYDTLTP